MMKLAKLDYLDPYIVNAIAEGRKPLNLRPGKLLVADLHLAWADQRQLLRFG
jgi:hypothetical protein